MSGPIVLGYTYSKYPSDKQYVVEKCMISFDLLFNKYTRDNLRYNAYLARSIMCLHCITTGIYVLVPLGSRFNWADQLINCCWWRDSVLTQIVIFCILLPLTPWFFKTININFLHLTTFGVFPKMHYQASTTNQQTHHNSARFPSPAVSWAQLLGLHWGPHI